MAAFDVWAEYYDLLHTGLPGDAEFYVGQAVRIGGETLEIGCGTGRITLAMALSGVDVTGLDDSQSMLEVCQAKAEEVGGLRGALSLVRSDMRDFELGRRFDLVVMPYRTFMHLLDDQERRTCLASIRNHMKDDGLFIFDTWHVTPFQLTRLHRGHDGQLELVSRYPVPGAGVTIAQYHSAEFMEDGKLLLEKHLVEEIDDVTGEVLRSVPLDMTRACSTPHDLLSLAEAGGFRVDALFGDFDCRPLTNESPEIIMALRKR